MYSLCMMGGKGVGGRGSSAGQAVWAEPFRGHPRNIHQLQNILCIDEGPS